MMFGELWMTVASPHRPSIVVVPRRLGFHWLIDDREDDATTQGWGDGKGWGMTILASAIVWTTIVLLAV
jgi:hypothetical protein